ncbi:hypothetical protein ACPYO6_07775 [Georgenia sp. Z1344]|uniref:hypothetical protein n=1 Tax=Georgenia sp. Z1344 TaxID=3416706 RepID=UPI003CF11DB5
MSSYGGGSNPGQGGRPGGYEDQFNQAYGNQGQGGYGNQAYGNQPQGGYGNPGGYGAAANPYGAGDGVMPGRTQRSTTGPKIVTFIGLGLIVLAIAAIIFAVGRIGGLVSDADFTTVGPGGAQIEAEAGEEWALYATNSENPEAQTQTCQVSGPDGAQVSLDDPSTDITVNDYSLGHRFTTDQAGTYTVTCNESAFVGHNVSGGEIAAPIVGIIGGILGGILGVIMLIIGVIWWIARRN